MAEAFIPPELEAFVELLATAIVRKIHVPSRYVTKEEACEILSITPTALKRMTQKREITCYQKGRLIRYDPADLIEWMASGKKAGGKP